MNVRQFLSAALAGWLLCAAPQFIAAAESSAPAPRLTIDELRARLNLTSQQQEQIAPFVEERRAKLEPIRAKIGPTASRRDRIAALREAKAIQDDFNGKVQPLLTPAQQEEWSKIRSEVREQMKERRRNR